MGCRDILMKTIILFSHRFNGFIQISILTDLGLYTILATSPDSPEASGEILC